METRAYDKTFIQEMRQNVISHPNVTELSFDTRIERQALIRFRAGGNLAEESMASLMKHFGWQLSVIKIVPPIPQG